MSLLKETSVATAKKIKNIFQGRKDEHKKTLLEVFSSSQ